MGLELLKAATPQLVEDQPCKQPDRKRTAKRRSSRLISHKFIDTSETIFSQINVTETLTLHSPHYNT